MSGARSAAGRLFHTPWTGETAVAVVCSGTRNSYSVGRSERIEDAGWQKLLTSAHSMSEGTVEPCRADTCRPELLS